MDALFFPFVFVGVAVRWVVLFMGYYLQRDFLLIAPVEVLDTAECFIFFITCSSYYLSNFNSAGKFGT